MNRIAMLNKEQKKAYNLAVDGKDIFITGKSGTGKSFTVACVADSLIGHTVALAPTHKAKKVLRDFFSENNKPVEVLTMHRFLGYVLNDGDPLSNKEAELYKMQESRRADTVIIDEISMVSNKFLNEIKACCDQLIVLGDMNQLPLIDKKAKKADLSKITKVKLVKQMRQERLDTELYQWINVYEKAIDKGVSKINFTPVSDQSLSISNSLVEDFCNHNIDVILAYTNATVNGFNSRIQTAIHGEDKLSSGQKMILQSPLKSMSIVNDKLRTKIIKNNGDSVELDDVSQIDGGYEVSIVGNEGTYYLQEVNSKQNWFNWMQSLGFKRKAYGTWKNEKIDAKLPYAMTVHKSQGSSYNDVGVCATDIAQCRNTTLKNKLMYVALSRARHSVRLI